MTTSPLKVRGFTLFEIALVLIIATAAALFAINALQREEQRKVATVVGEQIRTVADAVNAYIVNNYPALTAAPATDVTLAQLRAQSLLPTTFSDTNVQGSAYVIRLLRRGTAPNWNIEGLVLAAQPVTDGVAPSLSLSGFSLSAIGADGGMSYDGATLSGMNGAWAAVQADYPGINQAGQVGARVGYGTSQFTQFLRRDGSLPMTGALNMGGQAISNAGHTSMNTGEVRLVVTENTSCSTYSNGAFARTNEGVLLSCQSGNWKKASGSGGGGGASYKAFVEKFDGQIFNVYVGGQYYLSPYYYAYGWGQPQHMAYLQFCASCGQFGQILFYGYNSWWPWYGWIFLGTLEPSGYTPYYYPYWGPQGVQAVYYTHGVHHVDQRMVRASMTPYSVSVVLDGGCDGSASFTFHIDMLDAGQRSITVGQSSGGVISGNCNDQPSD